MMLPLDAESRQVRRQGYIDQAVKDAAKWESSIKCRFGAHADQYGGCANDGTGCLCECHDALRAATTKDDT